MDDDDTQPRFSATLSSDETFAREALTNAFTNELLALQNRRDLASRSQRRALQEFLRQLAN
jgi:hypothetical protein